jgi:hypothetical protein
MARGSIFQLRLLFIKKVQSDGGYASPERLKMKKLNSKLIDVFENYGSLFEHMIKSQSICRVQGTHLGLLSTK